MTSLPTKRDLLEWLLGVLFVVETILTCVVYDVPIHPC